MIFTNKQLKDMIIPLLLEQLLVLLAQSRCKGITREEVHTLVDEIFDEYK